VKQIATVVFLMSCFLICLGGEPSKAALRSAVEDRVKLQTVMINGCGGSGAGIVVREDGQWIYVLTAHHVVYDTGNSDCKTGTSQFFSPGALSNIVPFKTTTGVDKVNDLAAIKIERSRLGNFPFHFTFNLARDPTTLRRGDHLFIVGFSNSQTLWFVPPEPFFFADLGNRLLFGPSSSAYPGLSGGPICNADGEIVGIVLEKGKDIGNAVPVTSALSIYNRWGITTSRLFAEHRFPVVKPHYTEIGADATFPIFVGGVYSGDGPGASFHIAHGVTRLVAATFDTTILYARRTFSVLGQGQQGPTLFPAVETRQILMPNGGLQVQPFSGVPRRKVHETLGGFYVAGGMGWNFVASTTKSSVNGVVNQNSSSLMLTTEAGYRWPLPLRGWGLKASYRVYQPVRSEGLDRASSFTVGLYTIFR
jgi:hypothetical protein